jgi:hypothetical protein
VRASPVRRGGGRRAVCAGSLKEIPREVRSLVFADNCAVLDLGAEAVRVCSDAEVPPRNVLATIGVTTIVGSSCDIPSASQVIYSSIIISPITRTRIPRHLCERGFELRNFETGPGRKIEWLPYSGNISARA